MAGIAISANDAAAYITLHAAASDDPELSSGELTALVADARRMDADGNAPSSADWTATYDLTYAVAQAWLVKAGKAAGRYSFQIGGVRESESHVYDHCMRMHATWQDRQSGAAVIVGQVGQDTLADSAIINQAEDDD